MTNSIDYLDGRHLIEVYEATVLATDYWAGEGERKYVARCTCGWSTVRQLRRATENQVAKHRREVAA